MGYRDVGDIQGCLGKYRSVEGYTGIYWDVKGLGFPKVWKLPKERGMTWKTKWTVTQTLCFCRGL